MECSMVAINDVKTGFGRRFCITALVKTLEPNISPGFSSVGKIVAGAS